MKEVKIEPWAYTDFCVVCASQRDLHRHHVFPGTARRKKSDKYGYIITLCREHHTGREGIHHNRQMALFWMKAAQRHFEAHYGTREDFIKEFGKSWILED